MEKKGKVGKDNEKVGFIAREENDSNEIEKKQKTDDR